MKFEEVKNRMELLCRSLSIPVPKITKSLPTDICDVTDVDEIRLNLKAAEGENEDFYIGHVFGHYICDLHCFNSRYSDKVADVISDLVKNKLQSL